MSGNQADYNNLNSRVVQGFVTARASSAKFTLKDVIGDIIFLIITSSHFQALQINFIINIVVDCNGF